MSFTGLTGEKGFVVERTKMVRGSVMSNFGMSLEMKRVEKVPLVIIQEVEESGTNYGKR